MVVNMEEKKYLFIFSDNSFYEMYCGVSYEDALWEMSKYTNTSSEVLRKALWEPPITTDKGELTAIYNGLNPGHMIKRVYTFEERIV